MFGWLNRPPESPCHLMRATLALLAAPILMLSSTMAADAKSLAERLGYGPADRLVIINADDAGMCHAGNAAVMESFDKGLLTSSTIMVPCPWFLEIADYARQHPQSSFGVHLCHTSEWRYYRWGPVSPRESVLGLCDTNGFLWPDVEVVYAHATPAQALVEGRAQIQRALAAGVDVTHLDSHMGTLQYSLPYVEAYVQLAQEFNLPLRMASQSTLEKFGQPELRKQVAAKGIVFPDYLIHEELKAEKADVEAFWVNILTNLKPGVTELYIHPAKLSEELKAITGTWATRAAEFDAFTYGPRIRTLLADQKITRIGYKPLRELQRKGRPDAAK